MLTSYLDRVIRGYFCKEGRRTQLLITPSFRRAMLFTYMYHLPSFYLLITPTYRRAMLFTYVSPPLLLFTYNTNTLPETNMHELTYQRAMLFTYMYRLPSFYLLITPTYRRAMLFTYVSPPLLLFTYNTDRKSTRLNSSHSAKSRMPSSA